jgi:hypothetical protein
MVSEEEYKRAIESVPKLKEEVIKQQKLIHQYLFEQREIDYKSYSLQSN